MSEVKTWEDLVQQDDKDRFRLFRNTKVTAVLGLAQSGKTTFLTGMIDRINRVNGKSKPFFLGNSTLNVERLPPHEKDGGFPFDYYREDCLGNQLWPDKTVNTSHYRYRFHRSKEGFGKTFMQQFAEERTFVDLPGERLADFSMIKKTYAEWSDNLLEQIKSKRQYLVLAQDYLTLMENISSGSLNEEEVVNAYKRVLARFTHKLIPLVSPSTFLVHANGLYPKNIDPPPYEFDVEELVQRGVCGLDGANEFIPLSAAARGANPALAQCFEKRFNNYRQKLAEPLALGFYTCQHLLVLIDIGSIFEGGPAVYHSTRRLLQMVIEYLDPGRTTGELLRDWTYQIRISLSLFAMLFN